MYDFAKYHGLGNDFVLVDRAELPGPMTPAIAAALCDRRRGLGADGVLVREDAADSTARSRMVVHNADGSRPQMCGNGLRCFARWLHDAGHIEPTLDTFVVDTDAGPRACRLHDNSGEVTINMGVPSLERSALPMTGAGDTREELTIDGERVTLRGISVGNPHAIIRVDDADTMSWAQRLGPSLVAHPLFPERTNVEFAYLRDDATVGLTVYERGVGITQACGTGAVATVAALAADLGAAWLDREVGVDLPGGRLTIRIESAGDALGESWMRGPAVRVYEGRTRLWPASSTP